MTKKCQTEECFEEIQAWQNFCPKHYAEMMQKQQQIESAQVQEPKPIQAQVIDTQPPEMPEQVKKEEVKTVPMPKLEGKERLIVKQTSLKCAVELMKTMDNEAKEFNQIMQETETLTVYFYKIVVKENENLG